MKIYLSFLQSPIQHPIAAYSFWEYYIKNGIEEAGHQWVESKNLDWAKGLVPQTPAAFKEWKSKTWEAAIADIKAERPDIFLSYLYPEQIDVHAIGMIKKLGVKCINFFCDHVRMFKKVPQEFKVFDLNWVPEFKAIELYKDANLPFLNLPMPMWVEPKYRSLPENEHKNISFIGSKDIQRHLFFESLARKNANLTIDIYGSGWLDTSAVTPLPENSILQKGVNQVKFLTKHGPTAYFNKLKQKSYQSAISERLRPWLKTKPNFEEYIKITRESAITIGINRYPSFDYPLLQPDTYSRLRDIEAPMLGACYLTEWTDGMDELYHISDEIEVYRDIDELIEKCEYLTKDKAKRALLRAKGQQKALSEHSIPMILQKLINF
jgi:hypothetical protein